MPPFGMYATMIPGVPFPRSQCLLAQLPRGRVHYKTTYAPPAKRSTRFRAGIQSSSFKSYVRSNSRLPCWRSAREVMLILNINFADRAQFPHHIFKRPAGLGVALTGRSAHLQVFHHFFELFDRENYSRLAPLSIGDELKILLRRWFYK